MCVCAVSYTHLDVYKRQVQGTSKKLFKTSNYNEVAYKPRRKREVVRTIKRGLTKAEQDVLNRWSEEKNIMYS